MEYSYIDRTQKKQEEKSRNHDIEWYRRIFKQEEKNVFGWITSDDPKSWLKPSSCIRASLGLLGSEERYRWKKKEKRIQEMEKWEEEECNIIGIEEREKR